jgi:hypothetical protein
MTGLALMYETQVHLAKGSGCAALSRGEDKVVESEQADTLAHSERAGL